MNFYETRQEWERRYLSRSLRKCRTVTEAAKELGMSRQYLQKMLRARGVEYRPRHRHYGRWD